MEALPDTSLSDRLVSIKSDNSDLGPRHPGRRTTNMCTGNAGLWVVGKVFVRLCQSRMNYERNEIVTEVTKIIFLRVLAERSSGRHLASGHVPL